MMTSSSPDAFSILMSSSGKGGQRKDSKKDMKETGVIVIDDAAAPENVKYRLCLKAIYRQAFLAKFAPIFKASSPNIVVGGRNGQCWLVNGYAATQKGGPRASYQVYLDGRSCRVTISGAKAAIVFRMIRQAQAEQNTGDIVWPWSDDYEASHRCHMSNCIHPDHLVMETRPDNDDRSICAGQVQCRQCEVLLDACAHIPPCIWLTSAARCSNCTRRV